MCIEANALKIMFEQNDDLETTEAISPNRRVAIRYVRPDISAILLKKGFIKSTEILIQLLDISSKGALISSSIKLAVKNKVTLRLVFPDGKKFTLTATVVHKKNASKKQYGLKFDTMRNDLGEYLLFTQNDLIFK